MRYLTITFKDGTTEQLANPPGDYNDKEWNFTFRGHAFAATSRGWDDALEEAKREVRSPERRWRRSADELVMESLDGDRHRRRDREGWPLSLARSVARSVTFPAAASSSRSI